MQSTSLLYFALIRLAWLAPFLLAIYVLGLLIPGWRQFCSTSLVVGAIASVLLTTLYLFLALIFKVSLVGMEMEAWLGLSGAGFSIGCLFYVVIKRWRKNATKKP